MKKRAQRSAEPVSDATWPQLIAIMSLRLVVISCFIVVLAFLLPGDSVAFYAFMAFAFIATIPYSLWLKDRTRSMHIVPAQFAVDLLWVTGLVYFTGGLESDLSLLYPLVILSAGILTGPIQAMQITVLSALSYALLVVLMAKGILVPFRAPAAPVDLAQLWQAVGLRVFVFMCFGAASVYVSQRCQFADARVVRFQRVAEIIFRNVKAGLMLLDTGGRVLMANQRACELLGKNEQDLAGGPLEELIAEGSSLEVGETRGARVPCFLKRPNGGTFPASYEMSKITLPAEMVPGMKGKESVEVFIMVFSDIARLMEMQEKAKNLARIKAAAKMASEIAHEVRNPLTTISGSMQLLKKLEAAAAAGDDKSSAILAEERAGIYKRVVAESSRMDRIIERFIDLAEFSPEALARLFRYQQELTSESGSPEKEPEAVTREE